MSIKKIPSLIDAYASTRQERLASQRATDAIAAEENSLKQQLIAAMQENELTVAGSATSSVKLKTDDKPIATDWDQIYQYIRDNNAFDMLQRRLGIKAIELRWEDGIQIPGVSTYPVDKLTISTVK